MVFDVRYKGKKIICSIAAARELVKFEQTLYDVQEILENGIDAPRKRKNIIVERWLQRGSKIYNAVIAKDFNENMKEEVWVLVHFGRFSRGKRHEMPQMQ